MFFDQWPEQLAGLRAAVAAGDVGRAQHLAHAAKGNLAALEAVAGYEAARAVDVATKAGTLDGVPDLVDRLDRAVAAFREAYRASAVAAPPAPAPDTPSAVVA